MIIFEKVSKKFPIGTTALEDVSFQIQPKEFVFLVGQSGAGKTTILKLLLRELLPTKGDITVDEIRISTKKFKEISTLRRKIGIIFQDFKVLFDKNIFENIALSLQILGINQSLISDAVKESLHLVGLSKKEDVFPSQLSAGELQRIAIARAIVGDRDIILADEPTGNLDPQTTWDIMKIFKKLEGKKTIIIATHNTDVVNSFQKRVISLKNGKIIKDLEKGEYDI
ncbi:cell division ATP-binding protein FtsE [Candidatus Roizmanbacteria bacterium RIFCSPHIGHO2_02_FULL_39_9]|uniref:Cell division ATP-binding protein FtsE n=3 Tax=Candidatus Roizmaniibacteriota TaxID=1752723 RepID=A0A1F7HZN8_9BACT|nr:MAG: cell division ATP-binding protein FtsE [Candidatus Roizmanbacteria bacterium RIFCSPHIGHO2_02_FULL_39_9]OGK36586.1 MAG: cell division ATP-binding protein FtsE [Candidatus Roizmanbacteria bacterium RIFCSPHIGHO2_12_FULL_39_8]